MLSQAESSVVYREWWLSLSFHSMHDIMLLSNNVAVKIYMARDNQSR
jgi:hypothetical protein